MLWVSTRPTGSRDPQPAAAAVLLLLLEQAETGWLGCRAATVIHGSELPRVDHGLPKTVADEVFAQWIDPANLALLSERDRTLALVLAFTAFGSPAS